MVLKDKFKELRMKHNMTQDEVAERLGVSTQTVSKWERGIFAPDINLLPKIAVMYHCSIDSLFNMQSCWDEEHEKEFAEKIEKLREEGKFEELYRAYLDEIELNPDNFFLYQSVMWLVQDKKMTDDTHVARMLQLAKYAKKYCIDKKLTDKITILIMMICSNAQNIKYKKIATDFYENLPEVCHCREVYTEFAFNGDKLCRELSNNIIYFLCVVHKKYNLLSEINRETEEKLCFQKKAAKVAEILTEENNSDGFDIELIENYRNIAFSLASLGRHEESADYVKRIFVIIERRIAKLPKVKIPNLAAKAYLLEAENLYIDILKDMKNSALFNEWEEKLSETVKEYEKQLEKYLQK